jgi:hypothetical protein
MAAADQLWPPNGLVAEVTEGTGVSSDDDAPKTDRLDVWIPATS